MNRLLKLQSSLKNKPFGKELFSYFVARSAPYFLSIKPQIIELRENYMKVAMRKRRAVYNHIQTVHAIACCNLCEFAAGVCMEASIPKHRRWIPVGMQVSYLKKAATNLTAEVDLSATDWENCTEVSCDVKVKDTNGEVVVAAIITMKVSDKPPKK